MEISMIKKGTEGDLKNWIEMKTVNDIYQQALLLNKKDRKKLFKEFGKMNEASVLYKKECDSLIGSDSKLECKVFKWCKD